MNVIFDNMIHGFRCLVVANFSNCGYVGVPKGHKLYGVGYNDDDCPNEIEVHGGFTYADTFREAFGDDFWFFGWDHVHYGDAVRPEHRKTFDGMFSECHYWTEEEVISSVKDAAEKFNELYPVEVKA